METAALVIGILVAIGVGWIAGSRAASQSGKAELEAAITKAALLETRISDLQGQVAAAQGAAQDSRERAETLQSQLQAQTRLDDLLKPIKDSVTLLQSQSVQAEVKRVESDTLIKEQMQALRTHNESLLRETTRLAGALAKSATRGQWGEAQLERLLESAGLTKGVHYKTQDTRSSIEDPSQRPDVVVVLPGGGEVLVDSKFPLDRFIEATSASDIAQQNALLAQHAKDVLGHVKALSKKGYSQSQASPNFVVMFLPIESLLSSALEQEPTLLEQAFRDNVVLATPTSMLALLRTIAYGWSQDSAAKNVREITELGARLHERLQALVKSLNTVGNRIEQTASAYNQLVGSFQSRVMVTARQIGEKSGRTEAELEALDGATRVVADIRSLPPAPRDAGDTDELPLDS